jgi:lipopolysaccharide transport system ATP-binding protein
MPDVLIKCENVGKVFCRDLKRSLWYGLKDISADLFLRKQDSLPQHSGDVPLRAHEFWANQNVSFEVRRGECLGLIGGNGAGKTTLLKMLNGLIKPDAGRIEMRGRIGALIALGAGFNPVLTGRENVYINGSILGLSRRQIDDRFDEIVEFAELSDFIDSPVRSYSSGMQVRLGFAVAAVLVKPDILLLDEVLAVGDIGFTVKCLNAVRALAEESAVVLVSHSMQNISAFCNRLLVVSKGMVLEDTKQVHEGIDRYLSLFSTQAQVSGSGQATLESVTIHGSDSNADGSGEMIFNLGEKMSLKLAIRINDDVKKTKLLIYVTDEALSPVICLPLVDQTGAEILLDSGQHKLEFPIGEVDLNMGRYSFTIIIIDSVSNRTLSRQQGVAPFRVLANRVYWAPIVRAIAVER